MCIVLLKGSQVRFPNNDIFPSLKIFSILENSVDLDEMLHNAEFHLGLHFLPMYPFRGFQYTIFNCALYSLNPARYLKFLISSYFAFLISRYFVFLISRYLVFLLSRHLAFLISKYLVFLIYRYLAFPISRYLAILISRYFAFFISRYFQKPTDQNPHCFEMSILLLDFSLTVKEAPHEYVIRTSQP